MPVVLREWKTFSIKENLQDFFFEQREVFFLDFSMSTVQFWITECLGSLPPPFFYNRFVLKRVCLLNFQVEEEQKSCTLNRNKSSLAKPKSRCPKQIPNPMVLLPFETWSKRSNTIDMIRPWMVTKCFQKLLYFKGGKSWKWPNIQVFGETFWG